MSNIVEPILKMMKSNQGRAVAASAVLAGLVLSYSFLSNKRSSSKKEMEVHNVSRLSNVDQILQKAFSS